MTDLLKDLADKLDKKGMKMVFGLEAQGHIPTIEKILSKWNEPIIENQSDMTYAKCVWEEIGREIGWCPFTAALSYFEMKNKQSQIQ